MKFKYLVDNDQRVIKRSVHIIRKLRISANKMYSICVEWVADYFGLGST